MSSVQTALVRQSDISRDAVATVALNVVRRALVEGVPVTPEALAREASITLAAPAEEALREVDAVAQRLGVCGLM